MKIIVDTNIIFSTLLNSKSNVGNLIFNSDKVFQFYSCNYLKIEIDNHWDKIKKISKLDDNQLETAQELIFSRIKFIDEIIIPEKIWINSEALVKDIDEDDIAFIALTKFLKGTLWTGDKGLLKGLQKLKFKKIINYP